QLLRADARGRDDDADAARLLGIVHREAERLSSLVTAFLRYARPAPAQIAATSLPSLVQETVTAVRHGLDPRISLDADVKDDVVSSDADQCRQVMWNLVGNARHGVTQRFDEGVGAAHVVVTVPRDGDHGVLAVDDDGPGVPVELRSRIFEPFFTTRAEGSGL